jgi:hypothetical protein
MYIYNWYHSDIAGIHYVHGLRYSALLSDPLAFLLPLSFIPFCSPFVSLYLLGTLLAVIEIHLVPRLLVNLTLHFPPLAHIPLIPNPDPPGFPRSKYTLIRTTSRT